MNPNEQPAMNGVNDVDCKPGQKHVRNFPLMYPELKRHEIRTKGLFILTEKIMIMNGDGGQA